MLVAIAAGCFVLIVNFDQLIILIKKNVESGVFFAEIINNIVICV